MPNLPKILEIHQIEDWMLKKSKSFYEDFDILTFDDGLYSQFENSDFFQRIDRPKVYFFSTNIFRPSLTIKPEFKVCDVAHHDAIINHDYSGYMALAEIAELSKYPKTYIGMHGHNHVYLNNMKKVMQIKTVHEEVKKMLECFNRYSRNHNIKRVYNFDFFCAPYNFASVYEKCILREHKNYQYTNPNLTSAVKDAMSGKHYHLSMFGEGRIPIEKFDNNHESLMSKEVWFNDPSCI